MPVWWGQTVLALNCSLCRAVSRCYAQRVCMWCICVYVSAFASLLNTPLVLSDLALLASLASLQYRGASFCSQGKAPASQICNADFTPRIKWHYSEGHPHSTGSDLNCTHVPLNFFFEAFCWIFKAECPIVTSAAQITLITTCGSNSIAEMKFQLAQIRCVLVHVFLPPVQSKNPQQATVIAWLLRWAQKPVDAIRDPEAK